MSRIFYADSLIEVEAWGDREAFCCDDAEVWIEDASILVSYFDDEGIVVLEGHSDGASGWVLAARSRPRRATLSPTEAGGRSFAGSIEELNESGAWRLRLGEPTVASLED